jgi:hypothetical protein
MVALVEDIEDILRGRALDAPVKVSVEYGEPNLDIIDWDVDDETGGVILIIQEA